MGTVRWNQPGTSDLSPVDRERARWLFLSVRPRRADEPAPTTTTGDVRGLMERDLRCLEVKRVPLPRVLLLMATVVEYTASSNEILDLFIEFLTSFPVFGLRSALSCKSPATLSSCSRKLGKISLSKFSAFEGAYERKCVR